MASESPVAIIYNPDGTPYTSGNVISVNNTTSTPLNASNSFIGTLDNVLAYHEVDINVAGAPSVAPGTLYFEFSPNGTDWDVSIPLFLNGPSLIPLSLRIILPYFRIRYVNGGTNLTQLRITTLYHKFSGKSLTRFLNQTMDVNEPVENVRSVIVGQRPDLTFGNVPVSRDNFLRTSIDDIGFTAEDRLFAADKGIFGSGVIMPRISQILADFTTSFLNNDVSSETSGGASVSQSGGQLIISSGTNVTSSAKVYTNRNIKYAPGRENYGKFTVAFTSPTHSNSHQRVGIYNSTGSTNGFFVGYSGTTFGITIRKNGADTFTSLTNCNGDILDGNTNSKFTRDSVPEALNQSTENSYRIRYGSSIGPVFFQCMAPDGHWVTFHVINNANTINGTIITNPNLPITYEVIKNNADATVLSIRTCFCDGGTVEDSSKFGFIRVDDIITSNNDYVYIETKGIGDVGVQVSGTWNATLQFESTIDGYTWVNVKAFSISSGLPFSHTTANGAWVIAASGFNQIRVRASAFTSGTAYIYLQAAPITGIVPNITQADEPYVTKRFDITATITYTGAAPPGTLDSEAKWTIKKTTFDVLGNPTSQLVTAQNSAVWNNRATETYQ